MNPQEIINRLQAAAEPATDPFTHRAGWPRFLASSPWTQPGVNVAATLLLQTERLNPATEKRGITTRYENTRTTRNRKTRQPADRAAKSTGRTNTGHAKAVRKPVNVGKGPTTINQ
jgi:hypothetical protein